MKIVSFSQYNMWSTCPQQFKLRYIDKKSSFSANIHTLYGTALHETVQFYLHTMYNETKKKANELELNELLMYRMRENFKKDNAKNKDGNLVCTKEELIEFYEDGVQLLAWLKKNLARFYIKKGRELVGIEIPLDVEIRPNIKFKGYIDIIIKDLYDNTYTVIDLKTSTWGWSKNQKADKTKADQLLFYKKYYSDLYNVPEENIIVEFHILKRKINEDSEYTIPRASKVVPSQGKPSVKKAMERFNEFLDTVFTSDGQYNMDIPYPKVPGPGNKNCKWCEFYERGLCDGIAD